MLNAIEFKAKIKQGVIEIPEEYQAKLSEESEVKVIIIKQEKRAKTPIQKTPDIIDYLTENPIQVESFLSRQEIYDR